MMYNFDKMNFSFYKHYHCHLRIGQVLVDGAEYVWLSNSETGLVICYRSSVKFSCAELIKHYAMKAYGGVDV
jgi:hypothetical protein